MRYLLNIILALSAIFPSCLMAQNVSFLVHLESDVRFRPYEMDATLMYPIIDPNERTDISRNSIPNKTIYTHPSAFFCRLENKVAKRSILPIKMRLGSVDYVDRLEQKRN